MGVSIYVVLEKDIPGFDHVTSISGKALATALYDYEEEMETIARRSGVPPLLEFSSSEPEDMEDFFDDEDMEDDDADDDMDEEWFEAADGLKAVQAILDYFRQHPDLFQETPFGTNASLREPVIEDLENIEIILSKAKIESILWRLEMDI